MKNSIRVERARLKISQQQLAEEIGITRQSVHHIETEKTDPLLGTAAKIAKFFGLKIMDIFEEG